MLCLKCNTEMKLRNGKFGEFHFCPNQQRCGAKTITKNVEVTHSNSFETTMSVEYMMWSRSRMIDSLIPNYSEGELWEMYESDEIAINNGTYNEWNDAHIGY